MTRQIWLCAGLLAACNPIPWDPQTACRVGSTTVYHESSGASCVTDHALIDLAIRSLVEGGIAHEYEIAGLLDGREIWVFASDTIPWTDTQVVSGLYRADLDAPLDHRHPVWVGRRQLALAHELIHVVRIDLRGVKWGAGTNENDHVGWGDGSPSLYDVTRRYVRDALDIATDPR